MKRILVSWSSGKDSAWTLHVLRRQGGYEIAGLLTTFNEAADRVAMHAVRRELVEQQAALAGLPLWDVGLPWPCSNEQYENLTRRNRKEKGSWTFSKMPPNQHKHWSNHHPRKISCQKQQRSMYRGTKCFPKYPLPALIQRVAAAIAHHPPKQVLHGLDRLSSSQRM
jgi:hypothetical protein